MAEDIIRTPDLAIPMSRRGAGHMGAVLRGTEHEVWTKYLAHVGRHQANTKEDWMQMIEEAKRIPAKAYR